MDVAIELTGTGDELRSLAAWLGGERELRGRVRLPLPPTTSGTLGGISQVLEIALGSGGAGTVLASALIAWLRQRTSEVVCRVKRPDGTLLTVSATRARGVDTAGLRELLAGLCTVLSDTPAVDAGEEARTGAE